MAHPRKTFVQLSKSSSAKAAAFEWPEAVVKPSGKFYPANQKFEGYEAIGALRFSETVLQPGQSQILRPSSWR